MRSFSVTIMISQPSKVMNITVLRLTSPDGNLKRMHQMYNVSVRQTYQNGHQHDITHPTLKQTNKQTNTTHKNDKQKTTTTTLVCLVPLFSEVLGETDFAFTGRLYDVSFLLVHAFLYQLTHISFVFVKSDYNLRFRE